MSILAHGLRAAAGNKKPIEFIGAIRGTGLSNNDTSVTITGHQVGDLLLVSGYSANVAVNPTYTAGWNFIHQFYSPSNSQRLAIHIWKFADTASPIIVNFTNTGSTTSSLAASAVLIFRNASGIGDTAVKTNYTGNAVNSIAVPALSLQKTDGSSAVALSTYIFTNTNITAVTGCVISQGWAREMNATSFTGRTATVNSVQSILGVVEILN